MLAFLLSCQESLELKEPAGERDLVTNDDLGILKAVVADSYKTEYEEKLYDYAVVLNRTERYCDYAVRPWDQRCISDGPDYLFKRLPDLKTELKLALAARNTRFGIIQDLTATESIKLVNPAEIESHRSDFWKKFYEKFPGACGFVSFSLPGYSKDKNSAAIYYNAACGGACGARSIIELVRSDHGWTIKKRQIISMS